MIAPELSRPVRVDTVGGGRAVTVTASQEERAALVTRFELGSLDRLTGEWRLRAVVGGVEASGRIVAAGAQACVTTGEPVPFALDSDVALLFTDAPSFGSDAEVELSDPELDQLPIEAGLIDLGEATAQSLALELDPYPRAPDADERAAALGIRTEVEASPFAALLGLRGAD